MKTTALFAEILTVGLQTLCWIMLRLSTVVDFGPLSWELVTKWSALLSAVLLALAYSAGVVVDRLADGAATRFFGEHYDRKKPNKSAAAQRSANRAKRDKNLEEWGLSSIGELRMHVYSAGGGMVDFLEYQRSRIRIARATMINLIPAFFFGTVVAARAASSSSIRSVAITVGLTAGLAAVLLVRQTWLSIRDTYERRLIQAYKIMPRSGPTSSQ